MLRVDVLRCEYRNNPIGIHTGKPRLSWILSSDKRNVLQSAYRLQVFKDFKEVTECLWDSGKIDSDQSVHVQYEGPSLLSCCRYYFRVKVWDSYGHESEWSEQAFWEMGIIGESEWTANFITPDSEVDCTQSLPCPMLRKEFQLSGEVAAARIYVTSLGLYELSLNGERVGEELLTPGWTSYNKRLQYQTYDVTYMLREGNNAIGAILGDGWYKGNMTWDAKRNNYGAENALFMQMNLIFSDRREQVLVTDNSWKASTGPIIMSEIYHGEVYDARLEMPGWDKPGYDDSSWGAVREFAPNKSIFVGQENVPVKKIEEIEPIEIIKTPSGETVLDMGQNMVGWLRLKVKGPTGSRVVLKHGEVLDKDGNAYFANLRKAKQEIEYILKGEGEEIFEPHFTFQGFRYVKILEFPGEPTLENFTGVVIHSVMESTGDFKCSNELINKLQHNILWSQKGNFIDIPSDCPQRDERLGWTADAQIFLRTASFNMNTVTFFEKWLKDLKADQLKNGGVPNVIPNVVDDDYASSSAWGDAAVICPWTLYLCYGDKRVLEEQYESMKAWVEFIRGKAENGLIWNSGFHFGDWLALDAKEGSFYGATANDFVATTFYAYSTGLLAKAAEVLHKHDDAIKYVELKNSILEAFKNEFITPSGRLSVPTQTAHVLALMFNLVDEKDRKRTIDTLVKYIEENKSHLTTGFLGTPYICHVLSRNGRADIAYKLLLQTDYPSWLYQITQGATTIWEHWDGIKPDGSMWNVDMNSFNHYAYGAIDDWLYRVVAGIDMDEGEPAYKRIIIKPLPGGDIHYAEAELESMYGIIKSKWVLENDEMFIDIEIPHNTTAKVTLPGACIDEVLENDRNIVDSGVASCIQQTNEGVVLEVGSGKYSFRYRLHTVKASE
jgi:alpha-L-rhamnosidase